MPTGGVSDPGGSATSIWASRSTTPAAPAAWRAAGAVEG